MSFFQISRRFIAIFIIMASLQCSCVNRQMDVGLINDPDLDFVVHVNSDSIRIHGNTSVTWCRIYWESDAIRYLNDDDVILKLSPVNIEMLRRLIAESLVKSGDIALIITADDNMQRVFIKDHENSGDPNFRYISLHMAGWIREIQIQDWNKHDEMRLHEAISVFLMGGILDTLPPEDDSEP